MDKLQKWKEEYESVRPPVGLLEGMNQAMERAVWDKRKQKVRRRKWLSMAAALVVMFSIPNLDARAAQIMGDLPVIGGFFRLITFREYKYEDEHNEAQVELPQLVKEENSYLTPETVGEGMVDLNPGIEELNRRMEAYVNELLMGFESDKEEIEEGYQSLNVDYEVITENENWFTVKIDSLKIMASGAAEQRFFHLDKTTGEVADLEDIFEEGSDYITVLSDEIKRQMAEQMEEDENIAYFYLSDIQEEDFKQIRPDQNFYFNEQGELVISFDEYEVAPGYMGIVEFVIPSAIWKDIARNA